MAETIKKAKAPAKPRATAAKKAAAETTEEGTPKTAAKSTKTAAKSASKAVPATNSDHRHVPHEEIAQLAHHYWTQRGHKHGHHEEDWLRAEHELRGKKS